MNCKLRKKCCKKIIQVLNAHPLNVSLAISIIEERVNAFGEQLEIFPFPQSAFHGETDEDAFAWRVEIVFMSVESKCY